MKKLLVIGLLLFVVHIQGQEVVIDKVFVESKYNSRYILTFSNRLMPLGETINGATVDCLIKKLTESNMFVGIRSELVPAVKPGEYTLVLKPEYKGNPLNYRIRQIVIDKSLGLDGGALHKKLRSKKIRAGRNFLPYTEIEVAIIDSIETLEKSLGYENQSVSERSWISAYLLDESSIQLVVSGKPPECPYE